ncbi:hypothetical protein [Pararhodobacter sp.]|uniref:hypothetical protein n=1 Tax=Pararhodobacter sp. TaxID=2127056 RepID=UPI002FDE6A2F
MWKRKPTGLGGAGADGDFLILRGDQVVGRVLPAHFIPGTRSYIWSAFSYPAAHGRAESLDEAAEAVRAYIRSKWPDSVMSVPLGTEKGKDRR